MGAETVASTRLSYFQLDVMAFHGHILVHEPLKVKNLFDGRGKVLKHLQLCLNGCKSDKKILFLIYLIDFEICLGYIGCSNNYQFHSMINTSMKKMAIIVVLAAIPFGYLTAQDSQSKATGLVATQVLKHQADQVAFMNRDLFSVSADPAPQGLRQSAMQYQLLDFDSRRNVGLNDDFPEFFSTTIPFSNGSFRLLLYKVDIGSDGFQVLTSSGTRLNPTKGIAHYRGIVEGDERSVVSMTITETDIMAIISNDQGNFVVGKLANDVLNRHVIYNDKEIAGQFSYSCGTNTQILANPLPESAMRLDPVPPGTLTTKCVDWYYETDYDIFLGKGSVSAVNTYIQGMFNQVATLYNNDGISVTLQTLFIWDTTDPYTGTTTSNYLNQFGAYRTSFSGDLAMLIGYNGGGGVAYVNGLCATSNQYKMGYSAIQSSYQNVPTYSWTVEVVTHEGGHLLGSRHTHDCVWNGNNTRIDGCGPAAGYNSGSCASGPIPSSGTIMSYCHLVSGVGINFNNGFGPQPTSVMVNAINNAACLSSCINCPTPATPGAITISGGSNLICSGNTRAFSVVSVSGATSYNWVVPSGATITGGQGTNAINVSFGTSYPNSGNITVAAVNSCGSSATSSTTVSRLIPATPSVISGPTAGACSVSGVPYSVVQDSTITTYNWSFSSTNGTVSSGQGTNAITASFTTGTTALTLSVTASNSCGTSAARTLSIARIPAQPAPISGTTTPCKNQQGVPYGVPTVFGATSYRWLVPSGARIVAGGVTSSSTSLTTSFNNVLVNFKTTAGNVSVRSNNACGSSSYRSLAITFPCRDDGSAMMGMNEMMVNPNIVSESLQLQFQSSADAQVRIILMDISGRLVIKSNEAIYAGESQVGIDVSTLPQGVYSVQAEFNGVVKSARFVKQ